MAKLIVRSGSLAGQAVEVSSNVTLGRESADLTVDDPGVSRRHAVVRPSAGGLEIEDAGSLNGTWVNGSRIESPTFLVHGDRVEIGSITIEVEIPRSESGRTVARAQPRGSRTVIGTRPPHAEDSPPTPSARPVAVSAIPAAAAGTFSPPVAKRRQRAATRRLGPALFMLGTIAATAAALIVYFAQR